MYLILMESVLASRPVWYYSCTKESLADEKHRFESWVVIFLKFFVETVQGVVKNCIVC